MTQTNQTREVLPVCTDSLQDVIRESRSFTRNPAQPVYAALAVAMANRKPR